MRLPYCNIMTFVRRSAIIDFLQQLLRHTDAIAKKTWRKSLNVTVDRGYQWIY